MVKTTRLSTIREGTAVSTKRKNGNARTTSSTDDEVDRPTTDPIRPSRPDDDRHQPHH
jgi:hypothetical protein